MDVAILSGLVLIVLGVDQMHRPSAFIVGGIFLAGLGVLMARDSK